MSAYLRGSTKQCPKCGCRKVAHDPAATLKGYGPGIAVCVNCKAIWEPFEPEQIWDKTDPHCSFKEPCNNCAFRPGSPEQSDTEQWKLLLDRLKCGGSFYCHKGVPIEPNAKDGFAYAHRTISVVIDGKTVSKTVADEKKLRLCRGYLSALTALHRAYMRETKSGKLDVLAIAGMTPNE